MRWQAVERRDYRKRLVGFGVLEGEDRICILHGGTLKRERQAKMMAATPDLIEAGWGVLHHPGDPTWLGLLRLALEAAGPENHGVG